MILDKLKFSCKNRIQELVYERKTLYVIKGFGDYDFDDYNMQKLCNLDIMNKRNIDELDLQKILPSILEKIKTGQGLVISYEEFILVYNLIGTILTSVYRYSVIIIQNNLFNSYYPAPSALSQERAVLEIDTIDLDNKSILSHIYDEYYKYSDLYISYKPIDTEMTFEIQDLFSVKNKIIKDSKSLGQIISFGNSEESFLQTVIFAINSGKDDFKVVSSKNELDSYVLNFISIMNNNGYHFVLVKRVISIQKEDYSKFESILKRKNSCFEFKNIQFYLQPGLSLDTESISQGAIIKSITDNIENANVGKDYNDIFVTAPTGAGKSILFQIPAIYEAEVNKLFTIVLTPLIGLMNDQISNISDMTDKAATINSDYTPDQKEEIKHKIVAGDISILYVSPETLLSNNPISNLIGDRKIGLLVVDESHIVSTWGKSFRPDYWFLGDYISYLRSKQNFKFPIATFSATVTYGGNDDMHDDIIDSLKMRTGIYEYIAPMRRDDISFDIEVKEKKNDYLEEKNCTVNESLNKIYEQGIKTIAYFPFVKQIRQFYVSISGKKLGTYYGNMDARDKKENAQKFKNNEISLILATKAFGMGIDIDDISIVYHYAPTGNLCDYVQEIGRCARRSDLHGLAKIDYFKNDFRFINQLYGMSSINNYQIIETLRKLENIYISKDKKRNFTVSPDEFSFIFPNTNSSDEVDTRFKTTVLMIQKDFEKDTRINFKPIVFKPRAMFTKSYVMIKDDLLCLFSKTPLKKYFKIFSTKEEMATKYLDCRVRQLRDYTTNKITIDKSYIDVTVQYLGDIYVVDLKNMWEENYNDLSFAQFKHSFFAGDLSNFQISKEFMPEYLLTINSVDKNFEIMINKFILILVNIVNLFSKEKWSKRYFTINELAQDLISDKSLSTLKMNEYDSVAIASNIINLFSISKQSWC